jgi:hypothetical protein
MDESIDLRGQRKRLTSIAIAALIGLVVTVLAMRFMEAVSVEPNADPVGASMESLIAIAIYVITSAWLAGVIGRMRSRRRPIG